MRYIAVALSDFFSKESRGSRALKKTVQRANDKHAQSGDRWKALEALRDDGSPEAVLGLLRRFTFRYDKSIEDEQEKDWVYHTLVELGDKVLPQLRQHMRETDTLAWPLKVLEKVASGDTFRDALRELCERNDNSYIRDPTKKIQLVHFMGDHCDPVLAQLVVPYVEDADEGVRFTAVEAVVQQKNQEVGLVPLIKLFLTQSEESRRIKVRIAEGLAQLGWALNVHGGTAAQQTAEFERVLSELIPGARLDGQKKLKLPATER